LIGDYPQIATISPVLAPVQGGQGAAPTCVAISAVISCSPRIEIVEEFPEIFTLFFDYVWDTLSGVYSFFTAVASIS
jgi:hypothetical protein